MEHKIMKDWQFEFLKAKHTFMDLLMCINIILKL